MNASRAVALVAACVPLLAQESTPKQEPAPKFEAVKVEARQLPVSSQGKKAEGVDIVVTVAHAPVGEVKCEWRDKPGWCSAAEHWRAEVKFGATDAPGKTFALADTAALKKELELAASPKARTKHPDRVNISDATMSIRMPGSTPYRLVQSLLEVTGSAGIHRLEFAVVPAANAAEQRLPVPLPADEKAVRVDDAKTAPQEVRVALFADTMGKSMRLFGRAVFTGSAAGDAALLARLKEVRADHTRLGHTETPCIIDATAEMWWQDVVGVIDVCHAAGMRVEFAAAQPKK